MKHARTRLTRRECIAAVGKALAVAGVGAVAAGVGGRSFSPVFAATRYPDPGITDTSVTIGTTQPLTGPPAAGFGRPYQDGFNAYFDYVNQEKGGVNGRKIRLILYDDGYQPPKTVQFTRQLVEGDKVFATLFQLGTPTNQAILGYLNDNQVPNFPASNATIFGDPQKYPWTVLPTGPTNFNNAKIMGIHAAKTYPGQKVGVLFQNDSLGTEYADGFKAGVGNDRVIAASQSYETSDTTVDAQVINLQASGATVWFLAAIESFAVLAVRKAYEINWHPETYVIQQGTTSNAMNAMGPAATNKLVTYSTLKDPRDPEYQHDAGILPYQRILAKYRPQVDFTNQRVIEAMAMAHIFADQLARAQAPTRKAILQAFRTVRNYDTGIYLPLFNSNPKTNFLANAAQLARWDGKRFAPFGKVIAAM